MDQVRVPRNLLRDRITYEPYATGGARGAGYGTSVGPIHAGINPTSRLVMTPEGAEVVADYLVMVRPEQDIPVLSRITYQGQAYRVLKNAPMPDEFRPTHRELTLGRLP